MSIAAYAAYSKNEKIRFNSSSGGIFSELANYVYNLNGFVAGATFDPDYKSVSHIITQSSGELDKITTSKYVQSSFQIHRKVEEKLKNGKTVLCCGTPCQIAGLKSFLKTDYANLITVDFICHGTPMQSVWEKYLSWQEENYGEKVTFVNFRSKENGWSNYLLLLLFGDKKRYAQTSNKDPFMRLFLNNISLTEKCFECKYKGSNRCSDITLGDFWGINCVNPKLNDDKGISLVMINSDRGMHIFEAIKQTLFIQEVDENTALENNLCASQSVLKPAEYENFLSELDLLPFDELARKYLPSLPFKEKLKQFKLIRTGIIFRNKLLHR